MNCSHPLYAVDFGVSKETGKRIIKIAKPRADLSSRQALEARYGSVIPLPCGKCLSCKLNYSRNWSIRCMLEASLYSSNYFLTLTYDNEHLPSNLVKSDLQLFIKRLRSYIPGIRFFACGEYGETTHRPHYHLILFNAPISDLKVIGKGRIDGYYYSSNLIEKIWSKGNIQLGDVSLASCEYVARYVVKSYKSPFNDEFVLMSLKPGIGAGYFDKHYQAIYDTDGVYFKGKKLPVPRYFDKLLERLDPNFFKEIKYNRIKDVSAHRISELVDRGLLFDEQVLKIHDQIAVDRYKNARKGML